MFLGRRVGVRQATGYGLCAVSYAARLEQDQPTAIAVATEAADHFGAVGDHLARAQALHQLGCTLRDGREYERAHEALSEARAVRVEFGDRRSELLTNINTALLHAMAGDVERGLAEARACLSGFESAGDKVGLGATLSILGAVELIDGQVRAAREMYAEAAERLAPWRRAKGWLSLLVAELSEELDEPRRALREAGRAAESFGGQGCLKAGQRLSALRGRLAGGPPPDGGAMPR